MSAASVILGPPALQGASRARSATGAFEGQANDLRVRSPEIHERQARHTSGNGTVGDPNA